MRRAQARREHVRRAAVVAGRAAVADRTGCERQLLPLSGLDDLARFHRRVAVANVAALTSLSATAFAVASCLRGFVELALLAGSAYCSHDSVWKSSRPRGRFFASARSIAALYATMFDGDHVVPHPELHEDVRRHVERVRGGRRDLRIRARGGQREDRVIGIVERVNDVMRGARMLRVALEHAFGRCAAACIAFRMLLSPGRAVPSSASA